MLVDGSVAAGCRNQEGRILSEKRRIFKTTYPELEVALPNVVVGKIVRSKRRPTGVSEAAFHAERRVLLKEFVGSIPR